MNFRSAVPFAIIAIVMVFFGVKDGNDKVEYLIAAAAVLVGLVFLFKKSARSR